MANVVGLIGLYVRAIVGRKHEPPKLIERIVEFSKTSLSEGIGKVEGKFRPDDDTFLVQGMRLAIGGTEPDLVMDILETELQFIEERHLNNQRMVSFLGKSGLAFGAIGATLAVALHPEATGAALAAAAAVPLSYGLFIFGVLAEPFRRKLRVYSERESLVKRLIIEAVMSIQSGDNPQVVEHKLSVFLAPKWRPGPE